MSFFNPASFLPAGASAFSPLGGGVDDISPSTPEIVSSAATADTRINFSTGNMSSGTNFLSLASIGIIGVVALIGIVLVKTI